MTRAKNAAPDGYTLGVATVSSMVVYLAGLQSVPAGLYESAKLDGMRDFVVLHRTHTTLPWSRDAIEAAFTAKRAELEQQIEALRRDIRRLQLVTCPLPPYQIKGRKPRVERLIDLAVG